MNDVVTDAKAAADRARRGAARMAFWMTAYLLFGAFAATLAAVEGGQLRDGTWTTVARPAPLALSGSRKDENMPILLWLLGIPIPIIILLVLLAR